MTVICTVLCNASWLFIVDAVNTDRKRGAYSVASKHPAAGADESCSIYYNVKPSLESKASMPDCKNVKKSPAIPTVSVLLREQL